MRSSNCVFETFTGGQFEPAFTYAADGGAITVAAQFLITGQPVLDCNLTVVECANLYQAIVTTVDKPDHPPTDFTAPAVDTHATRIADLHLHAIYASDPGTGVPKMTFDIYLTDLERPPREGVHLHFVLSPQDANQCFTVLFWVSTFVGQPN